MQKKRTIQIEKSGSIYTKHQTERTYRKPTENCLQNDLTRQYVKFHTRMTKEKTSQRLFDR